MSKFELKLDKEFGNTLRKKRIESGLSKKEVARRIGLKSPRQITKWENAECFPGSLFILWLCKVYKTSSVVLCRPLLRQVLKDKEFMKHVREVKKMRRNKKRYLL